MTKEKFIELGTEWNIKTNIIMAISRGLLRGLELPVLPTRDRDNQILTWWIETYIINFKKHHRKVTATEVSDLLNISLEELIEVVTNGKQNKLIVNLADRTDRHNFEYVESKSWEMPLEANCYFSDGTEKTGSWTEKDLETLLPDYHGDYLKGLFIGRDKGTRSTMVDFYTVALQGMKELLASIEQNDIQIDIEELLRDNCITSKEEEDLFLLKNRHLFDIAERDRLKDIESMKQTIREIEKKLAVEIYIQNRRKP